MCNFCGRPTCAYMPCTQNLGEQMLGLDPFTDFPESWQESDANPEG